MRGEGLERAVTRRWEEQEGYAAVLGGGSGEGARGGWRNKTTPPCAVKLIVQEIKQGGADRPLHMETPVWEIPTSRAQERVI